MSNNKRNATGLRAEQADAMRTAVLAAARSLFAERGYEDTSLDDVAQLARATKGAVYHHFTDKRDLFRAVYDVLAGELVASIAAQAIAAAPTSARSSNAAQDDLVARALRVFLREASGGAQRRVLFQDGPMVLGGTECRAIDAKYGLGLLTQLVDLRVDGALVRDAGSELIARLVLALIIEAGQIIGVARDPARETERVERVLERVLDALQPKVSPEPAKPRAPKRKPRRRRVS